MNKNLLKSLFPAAVFPGAAVIGTEFLTSHGIKGVILDIDNTLMSDRKYTAAAEVLAWLKELHSIGIKTRIVSNSGSTRVKAVCEAIGIEGIHNARKPNRQGFRRAAGLMGLRPEEIAVVGDQIFTDIFGANRAGMLAILTVPIERDAKWYVRLKRVFEKPVLKSYHRSIGPGRNK